MPKRQLTIIANGWLTAITYELTHRGWEQDLRDVLLLFPTKAQMLIGHAIEDLELSGPDELIRDFDKFDFAFTIIDEDVTSEHTEIST